ncbi:MAG: hypothetical protein LBI27_02490 [Clostridiales bacterium]|jgi:hypothetical protein|nr:hypothetical protein [Clostridiales bacterium]
MAVISKPYSASLRFIDSSKKSVKTISKVRPNLFYVEADIVRHAINMIRRPGNDQVTNGIYTITDELVEA